jgi:hypothetical protein
MELDELHVLYPPFGPVGHGHAVTGGDRGVGGRAVSLAVAAGRQQGDLGKDLYNLVGVLIEGIYPIAFDIGRRLGDQVAQVVLGDQIEDEPVLDDLYILLFPDGVEQGPFDLLSGDILVMQDAEFGVTALPSQFKIPFGILVEAGTPFDDLLDPLRPFRLRRSLRYEDCKGRRRRSACPGYV